MNSKFLYTTLFALFASINLTFGQAYCDQAQGTAGFPDDIDCQTAICNADPYCCDTQWDAICAAAAAIEPDCSDCLIANAPVPSNDNGCNSEVLVYGVNNGYSNVNASVEASEVSPGAGTGTNTCQSQDGWCAAELIVDNSIWFTFTAPTSGNVVVSTDGSGFDTQLAVYSASACGDLTAGSATLIAANDDNPGFITTLFSSEVTLVCLTPGVTYYVQIDGYNGASGDVVVTLTDIGNFAGTLIADADTVCLVDSVTISATVDMAPVVPAGYSTLYVLTDADNNLTVVGASATPSFNITAGGNYIIHTLVYDPAVLDPTIAIGLPALDVNALLVQGGGAICAALDLAGAPVSVQGPMAGTLTADAATVCVGGTISATEDIAPEVPAGYATLYVLTDADNNLTVINASATPSFSADSAGNYIIHTLVYDPAVLDPTIAIGLEALTVNSLLVQGGGAICAALDLTGAAVAVEECDCEATAGTLESDGSIICEGGTISATEGDAPFVPSGYSVLYVLTDADENLTVIDAAATPSFSADSTGNFIIHTLIYDPNTLDPTTALGLEALVVNSLLVQGGGNICAALDLTGAAVTVELCTGVEEQSVPELSVYPNPSFGQLTVQFNSMETINNLEITDMTGRIVFSDAINSSGFVRRDLNLNVSSGTYLLRIIGEDVNENLRIQVR